MLAWCDAEITGKDKGRVLDACTVGDRCEIKGVIRRHGTFGWVKITSVRSLKQKESGGEYTELPKRFWGEWIDANDNMKMKVTADSILFGSSAPACKFTNIIVANEEETAFEVHWHCPASAAEVEIKTAWRLMKVWGKEVLVLVNYKHPTIVSIYRRAR